MTLNLWQVNYSRSFTGVPNPSQVEADDYVLTVGVSLDDVMKELKAIHRFVYRVDRINRAAWLGEVESERICLIPEEQPSLAESFYGLKPSPEPFSLPNFPPAE